MSRPFLALAALGLAFVAPAASASTLTLSAPVQDGSALPVVDASGTADRSAYLTVYFDKELDKACPANEDDVRLGESSSLAGVRTPAGSFAVRVSGLRGNRYFVGRYRLCGYLKEDQMSADDVPPVTVASGELVYGEEYVMAAGLIGLSNPLNSWGPAYFGRWQPDCSFGCDVDRTRITVTTSAAQRKKHRLPSTTIARSLPFVKDGESTVSYLKTTADMRRALKRVKAMTVTVTLVAKGAYGATVSKTQRFEPKGDGFCLGTAHAKCSVGSTPESGG
jgi:hypothetical protein